MEYRVEFTPQAREDLDRIYRWAADNAPYRGPLWFERFEITILSLRVSPERCMIVPKLHSASKCPAVSLRKTAASLRCLFRYLRRRCADTACSAWGARQARRGAYLTHSSPELTRISKLLNSPRHQLKHLSPPRPHRSEIPSIHRQNPLHSHPLRRRNHRSVRQLPIPILHQQLSHLRRILQQNPVQIEILNFTEKDTEFRTRHPQIVVERR